MSHERERLSPLTRVVACLIALLLLSAGPISAQTAGATIHGTLIDQQGNLGVGGATVTLYRDGEPVGRTQTDAGGNFAFAGEPTGAYYVVISANGYGTSRSANVTIGAGDAAASLALVLSRNATGGPREIGSVSTSVNSPAALQTTATVTRRADPQLIQDENFSRVGNALEGITGVNLRNRDTTVGDDLTIDIRGLKPSETQALLDGHPIGPLGVEPGTTATFNYQDSPPFALQSTQVTFGAGALNLYGTSTTGGTVDMQTWNPTPTNQFFFQQGFGDQGKSYTNMRATGTLGKLGFAVVNAVEGTYGPFAPQTIESNGALGTNFTSANVAFNTYTVSADYLLRNDLLKLRYDFSPETQLTLTGYSATSYDDKTGNGDNAYTTYPDQLYIAPVKTTGTCPNEVAVTTNGGTACMTAQQWAAATTGPQFARPAFQTIGNQDYHARLTTVAGSNNITLDGFIDAYNVIYNRNASTYDATGGYFNGGFYQNVYHTTGFLASDDIVLRNHTLGFGYYVQNQLVSGNTYQDPLLSGTPGAPALVARQNASLLNDNVFVRDAYTVTPKISVYSNVWLKSSSVTHGSSIDPRLSVVYRLTDRDVVRVAAAKSEGDPDPTLASGNLNTTPANINPPCGAYQAYEKAGGTGPYTGATTNVGQVGNTSLSPERATDLELAYGHRFNQDAQINVDVYDTNETNQIFNANVPATAYAGQIPNYLLNEYYQQITNLCGVTNPQLAFLTLTQASNQSAARFRGVEINGRLRMARGLFADYGYDIQSAVQLGVPNSLLLSNPYVVNGAQILLIPLHKYTLGLDWSTRAGLETRLDVEHLDAYNGLNRPGYYDANGYLKYSLRHGPVFTLGVYNVFNTDAQIYDYIGAGAYWAENSAVTQAANAYQENNVKLRGLTPRSVDFSISQRL
ncbi:MAG TPA: TonB-dependent receptor [Candidatus Limnocylindria bacterium]|nr:TonB-dependent receptor [Candidatus Limnocylindria bacterium]